MLAPMPWNNAFLQWLLFYICKLQKKNWTVPHKQKNRYHRQWKQTLTVPVRQACIYAFNKARHLSCSYPWKGGLPAHKGLTRSIASTTEDGWLLRWKYKVKHKMSTLQLLTFSPESWVAVFNPNEYNQSAKLSCQSCGHENLSWKRTLNDLTAIFLEMSISCDRWVFSTENAT